MSCSRRADTLGPDVSETDPAPLPKPSPWRGLSSRLALALTAPRTGGTPGPQQPISEGEKKQAIFNLDPREKKYGLIGAALAAVIALWQVLPYLFNPKNPVKLPVGKNHSCTSGFKYHQAANACEAVYDRAHWGFELAVLLAFALAIFVTVRFGRRSAAGFAALMAGLAFEAEVGILGIPFIFGGGWLLMRAWRVQRYGSPTATKGNPSGEKRPPPARTERPTRKAKQPEKKGPVASKRYTPKSQKRKRPAPTPPSSSAPSAAGPARRPAGGRASGRSAPPRAPAAPRPRSPCR